MDVLIEQIVQKLHDLPELKLRSVLDFVEFLNWSRSTPIPKDEEFEKIADRLADDFQLSTGNRIIHLSDYAVSRSGIYEEHP